MKISSKTCALLFSFLASVLLSGCSPKEPESSVKIANPAAEYCVKKGGKLEIVKDNSDEKSMCHLPDGTVVDAWELFRRDNQQN